MERSKLIRGYIFIILSAVIYGCMPMMASFIYEDGVNAMTLVFLQNVLSLPVLAVLALLQKKTLLIPVRALPVISVIALLGSCITPVLLFSSYFYMASGTATVFHFIYPVVVVLAGYLFFRQRAKLREIVSVIICAAGIFMFYTPGEPIDWRGSAFALTSSVTYAAYILILAAFRYRQVNGFLFSFYTTLISSIATFILCITTDNLSLPGTAAGWILCVVFGIAITVGAVVLFQQGTFLVGGQRAAILSTLEPLTSIIMGAIVLEEIIGPRVAVGSVLVLAASVMIGMGDLKKAK